MQGPVACGGGGSPEHWQRRTKLWTEIILSILDTLVFFMHFFISLVSKLCQTSVPGIFSSTLQMSFQYGSGFVCGPQTFCAILNKTLYTTLMDTILKKTDTDSNTTRTWLRPGLVTRPSKNVKTKFKVTHINSTKPKSRLNMGSYKSSSFSVVGSVLRVFKAKQVLVNCSKLSWLCIGYVFNGV